MRYVDFPVLGRRPLDEFVIGGALEPEPADLAGASAGRWLYMRDGVARERAEWWYHTPTRLWFEVRRDTGTDRIVEVELALGADRG